MYMQMFVLCNGLLQKNALSLKITSRAQYLYFKINLESGNGVNSLLYFTSCYIGYCVMALKDSGLHTGARQA